MKKIILKLKYFFTNYKTITPSDNIQESINELVKSKSWWKITNVIFLEPGHYDLKDSVTIPKNTSLTHQK